jgi:hypothetical protein
MATCDIDKFFDDLVANGAKELDADRYFRCLRSGIKPQMAVKISAIRTSRKG